MGRHLVIKIISVQALSVLRVLDKIFKKGVADAHKRGTQKLVFRGIEADNPADILGRDIV